MANKILYKLTDQDMQTYKGFQWELGKWYETSGKGKLCGDGWIHAYEHPLLAILHNPIHADIDKPLLFEMEYEGRKKRDGYMKCGVSKARLVKEIPVPEITIEQCVRYAILCVKKVYAEPNWNPWADKWLSSEDRSENSAWTAEAAARAATWAAVVNKRINLIKIAKEACK